MTPPAPDGYRTERLGRLSLAVPDAFGSNATFRTRLCKLCDEPWPVPTGGTPEARRAARGTDRDALWSRWFTEVVAKAVHQDPDALDLDAVHPLDRRSVPSMLEERQLGRPDPDGPVESPPPGERWARAAMYLDKVPPTNFVQGRLLLDAGPNRLWAKISLVIALRDRLFDLLADVAADYRVETLEAPSGAFVLRHGHVLGTDDLPGPIAESVRAYFEAPRSSGSALDHVKLITKVINEDPAPYDWTFDEGLAATNAMGRSVGVSFEKVREGAVRSSGGVEGYESVSLYRERGARVRIALSFAWHAQGVRADPQRPEVEVKSKAELDPSLSGAALAAAVARALAAWDAVVASVRFPGVECPMIPDEVSQ